MTGLDPAMLGAVQEMVACAGEPLAMPLTLVAVIAVGAPGGAAGTTGEEAVELGPAPAALVATTVKV